MLKHSLIGGLAEAVVGALSIHGGRTLRFAPAWRVRCQGRLANLGR
ncbi:hypothetical protein PROPHIT491_40 [Mycobacterium phage prophiT49-1]|nr:hypothetical protein PROPHIT491_40 [Mycobacterium phage prophiT49-1]